MKLTILILALILLVGCSTSKKSELAAKDKTPQITIVDSKGPSVITGKVENGKGEPLPFAKVMLILNNRIVQGTTTDLDGRFKIEQIEPATYDLEINLLGYEPQRISGLKVEASTSITFELIESKEIEVISLKPIIYLYPQKEMDIAVELNYKGKLTHTYPNYPEGGWKVQAKPDGTIFDEKGVEYYALFWEGKPTTPIHPSDGFVVAGDETVSFLETTLAELGLNRREANEFIMFWLPQLENNPFNLIHFSNAAYEDLAELKITPAPETLIRVMMITKPLKEKIFCPLQDISHLKKKRVGYTVVEWGGSLWPSVVN